MTRLELTIQVLILSLQTAVSLFLGILGNQVRVNISQGLLVLMLIGLVVLTVAINVYSALYNSETSPKSKPVITPQYADDTSEKQQQPKLSPSEVIGGQRINDYVLWQGIKGSMGGALGVGIAGLIAGWIVSSTGAGNIAGAILGALFGPDDIKVINKIRGKKHFFLGVFYILVGAITGYVLGGFIGQSPYVWMKVWATLGAIDGFIIGIYAGLSGYIMPIGWANVGNIKRM